MIRKLFCALTIGLVLCGSVQAQEVLYSGENVMTGQTLYFTTKAGVGHSDVGKYWNGMAWATYTTTRSTWKVAMSEVGVTGDFTGFLHSGAEGPIIVKIYQDADDNGTPDHEDDILLEIQAGYWDGTTFSTYITLTEEQVNLIAAAVADTGGPIEQREVSPARRLQVRSRADGSFGIVGGQRVRMLPGEKSLWSVDLRGTQVPVNHNLFGMEEPTFTGAEAAQLTLVDYGVDDTEAKFEIELDDDALTTDTINVRLEIHPSSTETIVVVVPVTVGS